MGDEEIVTIQGPNEKAIKKGMVKWDKDGPVGGRSSIEILVEWLKVPGNFDLYKLDSAGGTMRKKCLNDVVNLLIKQNIHHRTQEDVRKKLRDLELAFANTHTKVLDLGSMTSANGGSGTFELKSKFVYYYDLLPVFKKHYDAQASNTQVVSDILQGKKGTRQIAPYIGKIF